MRCSNSVEFREHHTPFLILSFDTNTDVGVARPARLVAPVSFLEALTVKGRNQSAVVTEQVTLWSRHVGE